MADPAGLSLVERGALEALDRTGAGPDQSRVPCPRVLEVARDELGLEPRYCFDTLAALSCSWLVPIPLVDISGAIDPGALRPGDASRSRARLTTAGELALASARNALPPLPIGLVNGDLYVDGRRPPFDPHRILDALDALLGGEVGETDEDALLDVLGLPAFPTGCTVSTDRAALAAGRPARLRTTALVTTATQDTNGAGPHLVISQLAPMVGPADVVDALLDAADGVTADEADRPVFTTPPLEPEDGPEALAGPLPLHDVVDESPTVGDPVDDRIICLPEPGVDLDELAQRVRRTWPVTYEIDVCLPEPLIDLLHDLVADSDADEQRAAFDRLRATLPPRPAAKASQAS